MANLIVGIISLTISLVVLANVFISTVKNTATNYTCGLYYPNGTGYIGECTWSTSEIALWGLLTLIAIAGMAYGVVNVFGLA